MCNVELSLTHNSTNIAISHINSIPLEKLGGKSPLETAEFMWHDLYRRLMAFGIRQIEKGVYSYFVWLIGKLQLFVFNREIYKNKCCGLHPSTCRNIYCK